MVELKIKITAYTDNENPGWVSCEFNDIYGKTHFFIEKVPVVTTLKLDLNSPYPQEGIIQCLEVKRTLNQNGMTMITVNSEKPWGIESLEKINQFDIFEAQLKKASS